RDAAIHLPPAGTCTEAYLRRTPTPTRLGGPKRSSSLRAASEPPPDPVEVTLPESVMCGNGEEAIPEFSGSRPRFFMGQNQLTGYRILDKRPWVTGENSQSGIRTCAGSPQGEAEESRVRTGHRADESCAFLHDPTGHAGTGRGF